MTTADGGQEDVLDALRGLETHSCFACDRWSVYPCEDAVEVDALAKRAADEIERLRALLSKEADA